jgi:hypothetical protein
LPSLLPTFSAPCCQEAMAIETLCATPGGFRHATNYCVTSAQIYLSELKIVKTKSTVKSYVSSVDLFKGGLVCCLFRPHRHTDVVNSLLFLRGIVHFKKPYCIFISQNKRDCNCNEELVSFLSQYYLYEAAPSQ